METPIELIPLNCIRCGAPIPAEIDEIAWACTQCEQGQQLGEDGLIPLTIHYAQEITPPQKGKPFWVCRGTVTMQRDTDTQTKSSQDSEQFWAQPHNFFIPASPYPLDAFAQASVAWLKHPPALHPGPLAAFEAITVAAHDVRAWIEFSVISIEAEREDDLKKIEFTLDLETPLLWVLP